MGRASTGTAMSQCAREPASRPGVGAAGRSTAPTPPARTAHEASDLFSYDLLEDVAIERQVRHQLLQFRILVTQRPQLADRGQAEAGKLLFLAVEGLLTDAEPATDLGDFLPALDLVQRVNDHLVAVSLTWHLAAPSAGRAGPRRKPQIARFSPFRCRGFRGLGPILSRLRGVTSKACVLHRQRSLRYRLLRNVRKR